MGVIVVCLKIEQGILLHALLLVWKDILEPCVRVSTEFVHPEQSLFMEFTSRPKLGERACLSMHHVTPQAVPMHRTSQ